MKSSWVGSTERCRPSSSRGKRLRMPTPTPKFSKTWAWLPRPWRKHTRTCEALFKPTWGDLFDPDRIRQLCGSVIYWQSQGLSTRITCCKWINLISSSGNPINRQNDGRTLEHRIVLVCVYQDVLNCKYFSHLSTCPVGFQRSRQHRWPDGRYRRTTWSGSRNLRYNFQTDWSRNRFWRGKKKDQTGTDIILCF